ncbi:MAG: hypothetical protein BroJett038_35240 [Chloroflexota bacterium]|nr:MAG: hypothetical protein BroJett038_35240 [Chloroflexota bacterium]
MSILAPLPNLTGAWPARLLALPLICFLLASGLEASESVPPAASAADPRLGQPFANRPRPQLGRDDAPIVVLEVSSFTCGHCRLFHEREFGALRTQYVDTGKVQWFMLNASFEIADAGSVAFVLGRCASRAGSYWSILNNLFQHGRKPNDQLIQILAGNPALDRATLSGCLRDRSLVQLVLQDFAEVQKLKLKVTPTFFVRRIHADGRRTEAVIENYQNADYFRQVFDRLLALP